MRITVDTNILVRVTVLDDREQASLAAELLRTAECTAIPLSSLCEFVWVTMRAYHRAAGEVIEAIMALINSPGVATDRPAVEAGLAMLAAGGDFADGVIAFDGRRLGGWTFASFDRKAVELVAAQGGDTHVPGSGAA
ncbi:MAG TPA: type II toxin-antitoxin system VapC family toxin [Stellaceae bacterium]|nr:type II toxin-antitoxin system VapC family toxin [Stellaceae bacterium]